MRHDHGHGHGHGHVHAHPHGHPHADVDVRAPAVRDAVAPSVLMSGAATRVATVLGALAALWAAVAWALTDLSA